MWVEKKNNLILRACRKLESIEEENLTRADKQRKRWVIEIKGETGEKLHHSRKNLGFRVRATILWIPALLLTSQVLWRNKVTDDSGNGDGDDSSNDGGDAAANGGDDSGNGVGGDDGGGDDGGGSDKDGGDGNWKTV